MSDSDDEEVQCRTIKITIVGEPSTGKSSLCHRYLGGGAGDSTQGAEVMAGLCLGLGPPVPLHLCDVAGNSLTTKMLDNYLYASDVVMFVYDLANLQSFEKLPLWIAKVKEVFENETMKPLMALFGNKSDLEHQRAVRLSGAQKLASEHLLENFKGSARTGDMVHTVFTSLVARVLGIKLRRPPSLPQGPSPDPVYISQQRSQSLIMTRKALRKMQRKASSTICSVQ